MKKIMLYILTIFVMFIGINGVSAKTEQATCQYSMINQLDSKKTDIVLHMYDDKTSSIDIVYLSYMYQAPGELESSLHAIVDQTAYPAYWQADDDFYASGTATCPERVFITYNGPVTFYFYNMVSSVKQRYYNAYKDKGYTTNAVERTVSCNYCVSALYSGTQLSDRMLTAVKRSIADNMARVTSFNEINVDEYLDSCKNDGNLCPYCDCETSIKNTWNVISVTNEDIETDAKNEEVANMSEYKEYHSEYLKAEKKYNDLTSSLSERKDPNGGGSGDAKDKDKDKEGTAVTDCKGLLGPNTYELLKAIMRFIMIIGPIIAVVLGTYDMVTAMASGEEDAKKKGIKKLQNRLIAVALLLLVPYIVSFILGIVQKSNCW